MKAFFRLVMFACAIVSAAASAAAQSPGFSAADSKELASYRLTMEAAKKWQGAMRLLMEEMLRDPRVQALNKTTAEIEALEKKEEPTDAESERLMALREQKEQQEEALDSDNPMNMADAKTLGEMEAQVKSQPQVVRALTQVGMSPREYSKFSLAMLMAGMVAGFQKAGTIKDVPKELKEIHPDNIKFMLDHEAELVAMQKELAELGKGKR